MHICIYGQARGQVTVSWYAMEVSTRCSEHVYVASKWRSVMSLATKCAEKCLAMVGEASYDKIDVALD